MSSKSVTTMTSHHLNELDSATTDSVKSASLQSDYAPDHENQPRVRFMCSFGGKILPRPHDNQLRYVGGDTRIVVVHRHTTYSSLLNKLSKLSGTTTNLTVKYQLPNEDLDALISVTTDEDVDNMMEEYERVSHNQIYSKTARLRLFLFSADIVDSRHSSISSLLGGSAKREHWFLDALNGGAGPGLERGRSEVSSILSEVPDYLFGLENSDDPPRETKLKNRFALSDNVSVSDPGSPAPPVSSPFCSTSSSLAPPPIPDLPPVKTKPDNPVPVVESREVQNEGFAKTGEPPISQLTGYAGKPMWHYPPEAHYPGTAVQSIPFYYVPGPGSQGNVPLQPVQIRAPYVQQFAVPPGQIPVRFHQTVPGMGQVYGGGMRPATMDPYDMSARVVPDGVNSPMYYGVRNGGVAPPYPGMVMPVGEELQGTRTEATMDRVFQSS